MAGPKRWGWKNQREVKNQYQYTFLFNMCIGSALTYPFAVWVSRRMQRYQGGVPLVPYNRYVHDFVNVEPAALARKTFRQYFSIITLTGGFLFAVFTVHQNQKNDAWFSRPDIRPFPAMVAKETMDITERTMYETHYQSYRNKAYADEKKHRTWYRLFFPLDADYSVTRNPYH